MDKLIKEFGSNQNEISSVTLFDATTGMIFALVLGIVLAIFYLKTHTGYSYSRNYVFSLVLLSLTVSLIMIIIGSNIARAFALVGAMSIVRFRNPIKETRDLVYIFMSIAIGMVCGTGFYFYAIIFLFLIGIVEIIFKYTFFGSFQKNNFILSLTLNDDKFNDLISIVKNKFKSYSIISKEFIGVNNEKVILIINLSLKKNQSLENIHKDEDLRGIVNKIDILSGEENIEN